MTAPRERAQGPLLGALLFLAIAVGCGLSYYYGGNHPSGPGAPDAGRAAISGGMSASDAPPPARPAADDADAVTGRTPPAAPDAREAPDTSPQSGDAVPPGADDAAPVSAHGTKDAEAPAPAPPPARHDDAAPGAALYGKGRPVTPKGSVVRGDIPPGQEKAGARIAPTGQDSVVGFALIRDMARFLAENYWPAGSHPMAGEHGISTAGVKWANTRYGGQLRGFDDASGDPSFVRERVLGYVLMPSMVRALYGLYGDRFYETLRAEASAQKRGPENAPLAPAQMAEMFAMYSGMAGDLAGAVRAYVNTPRIRSLAAEYARDSTAAASAPGEQAYRSALQGRERAKSALVSAMRRSGAGQGIDSESLAYTAQWLYRRGEQNAPALAALAGVLDDCSRRLSALAREYQSPPPVPSLENGGAEHRFIPDRSEP